MINALGLLEVRGLTAGIEAADAMLKAAQVRLLSQTHIPPGLITLVIEGDLAACRAALDAGSAAAARLGTVIARKEIGRPERDTECFVSSLHKLSLEEMRQSVTDKAQTKPTATPNKQDVSSNSKAPATIHDKKANEISETNLVSFVAEHITQGRNITEIMAHFEVNRAVAKRSLENCISRGKIRKRGNRYYLVEVTK